MNNLDKTLDELSNKRKDKYFDENKISILNIINMLKNKDAIKTSQETFKVDSLKSMRRLETLVKEVYKDETLILKNYFDDKNDLLSVYRITDNNKLFSVLNDNLLEVLGEGYTVTYEKLAIPNCLSFSNEILKLYLLNYDRGVVGV
jgi:hypothetical protein